MVARVNSAEGGSNGTGVTTVNSGGTSGNAWDSLSIPGSTSIQFATAAAYKGTLGYRVAPGTDSGAGPNLRWTLEGWTKVRARFYFRMSALPTSEAQLAYITNSGNAKALARVRVTTSGKLRLTNADDDSVWTSAAALSTGTWYRVEWIVVPGTKSNNGTNSIMYAAADGAAVETHTASGNSNTGTGGTLGRLYLGKLGGVWNASVDIDDLAADDQSATSFLGASAASGTPVVVDPAVPPPIAPAPPPTDIFSDAIRSSVAMWWTVDASYAGAPVEGATGLAPTGGRVTDTTKPGVRRTLELELAPEPRLYDLLSPIGTTLTVTAHVRYTNRTVVDSPLGVFDVDSSKISEGGGSITLTAPDKWVRIQRARFLYPSPSYSGVTVVQQLVNMIRDCLGADEPVNVTATSQAQMPAMVWDKDRDKAIIDLAASIGAWVYFDRTGVATIADVPTGASSRVWPVHADDDGVLLSLDRETSRTTTYNIVVVSSSATDGELFPVQYVYDDDPASPTYAGNSPYDPTGAGPFGLVPYFYDTPVLATTNEARAAGLTILRRVSGLASSVTLTAVPNPQINAFDVLEVLPPPRFFRDSRPIESHVVDTVTHPLVIGTAQQIDGRSTRADVVAGG